MSLIKLFSSSMQGKQYNHLILGYILTAFSFCLTAQLLSGVTLFVRASREM